MASQFTSRIARKAFLRNVLASGKALKPNNRSFHASACTAVDALDMADTFSRRHCE